MSQHVIGPTTALNPSHAPPASIVATCIPSTYSKLAEVIGLVMVSVPPDVKAIESVHTHLQNIYNTLMYRQWMF